MGWVSVLMINVTDEDISEFITLFRDFDKFKGLNTI